MATVLIDRDAAHDAAQRELAKPTYPKQNFTERLRDWIDEFIYRLVTHGSDVPGGWFTIAVLLTLLAVAIVVAVRIARRTMKTNRNGDPALFGVAEFSAAEHRATAERFAADGDWAAAIRHRLRAVARQLEENGALTAVPGRTANELARDTGKLLPGLTWKLADAAGAFNDVTYGERPGSEPEYRNIAELDEQIRTRRFAAAGDGASPDGTESWAHLQ